MKNKRKMRVLGPVIFLAIFAAAAAAVMLLWNWLVPSVIGWAAIGYWQAAGLLLLCKLLFGGFCKGGPGRFHGRHPHMHHLTHEQKMRMREQVKGMSPAERREHIRKHMFGDCCPDTRGPQDGER